jgi:hypothetical protein
MQIRNHLKFLLIIFFMLLSFTKNSYSQIQLNDSTRVMTVIQKMFEGMKLANKKLFISAFDSSAVLMSIGNSLGKTNIHTDDYISFAQAVGTPHPQVWDERITNPVIHISGDLASVWAEYSFYLGDKLNHCGIDSFQLVKRDDGWKILVIVDTRRKEGCEK